MAHTFVNHPLRPIYRTLAALIGLYFVAFGIFGAITTADGGLFGKPDDEVFSQGTNLAWSIIAALVGIAVLVAIVLGRNRDVTVNVYSAWTLLVIGLAMLALIRTSANVFNFSIFTVVVTWLAALGLLTAGNYSKVAPPEETTTPQPVRQSRA
jgi:uncharacterized membrane protein YhaH (DUF805 family)